MESSKLLPLVAAIIRLERKVIEPFVTKPIKSMLKTLKKPVLVRCCPSALQCCTCSTDLQLLYCRLLPSCCVLHDVKCRQAR